MSVKVNYSLCEIWAGNIDQYDFAALEKRGFHLITDDSKKYFRISKIDPDQDDIRLAYGLQDKFTARGLFSTVELTGYGKAVLPNNIETVNTYSEKGMTCTELTYKSKPYQVAVRGDKVIIGSPIIGVGY